MRETYAHTAVLDLTGGDERAPGAAITVALCGAYDHEPPCPLAAHRTEAVRDGGEVRLRVLFAAEPGDEARVRAGIDEGLATGELTGPDGVVTRWRLLRSAPAEVAAADAALARRLRAS